MTASWPKLCMLRADRTSYFTWQSSIVQPHYQGSRQLFGGEGADVRYVGHCKNKKVAKIPHMVLCYVTVTLWLCCLIIISLHLDAMFVRIAKHIASQFTISMSATNCIYAGAPRCKKAIVSGGHHRVEANAIWSWELRHCIKQWTLVMVTLWNCTSYPFFSSYGQRQRQTYQQWFG